MERLLAPEEAAARMAVSPRSIREWLRKGKIRGVKAGRLWRIRERDLEKFLGLEHPKSVEIRQGDPFLKVIGRLSADPFLQEEIDTVLYGKVR